MLLPEQLLQYHRGVNTYATGGPVSNDTEAADHRVYFSWTFYTLFIVYFITHTHVTPLIRNIFNPSPDFIFANHELYNAEGFQLNWNIKLLLISDSLDTK